MRWLERAIIARCHQLEVRLAWSVGLTYDMLDIELINRERSN